MFSLSVSKGAAVARPSSSSRRTTVKVQAFKVTFDMPTGQRVVEVDAKTSLLDAAEKAGVDLPSLCRSGACGSCASKVTSGQVEMADDVMPHEQADLGYVFLCSAYPRSDMTLKTHQEEDMYMATLAPTCGRL